MLDLFIKIGFLEIRLLDIIDIILVGLLLYQIYKLLRGSLALNIFAGLLFIFLVWMVVQALNMRLLAGILGQFVGVGVIALLIVFQPEVRRFLLLIGRGSILKREGFFRRFIAKEWGVQDSKEEYVKEVVNAVIDFSSTSTGAIIVFAKTSKLQFFANTGVLINGVISSKLIESIFDKSTPLHDGAMIIAENKILAAGCVLPVSENPDLPPRVGMRHRAAVGITEHSDAVVIVVSEETGQISYARNGRLHVNITEKDASRLINAALSDEDWDDKVEL